MMNPRWYSPRVVWIIQPPAILKPCHFRREADIATARLNLIGHHTGNGGVVDDSFLGHTKSGKADGMGLKFANLFVDRATRSPARPLALPRSNKACRRGTSSSLVASTIFPHSSWGISCCTQKSTILPNALNRQASLGRTRLVVQPTVQNAAVMSGLMAAGTAFLLQKKQPRRRKSLK